MTVKSDPFDDISRFYAGLVAHYGHDPRALDYGGRQGQRARFEVLAAVAPLAGKRVLDVGCGFADFAEFLAERVGNADYVGLDLSEAVVGEARRLRPELDIRHGNLLDMPAERFDVVVANGIFYLLGADADALMRRLIVRMWEQAEQAVAFSSLSSWADAGEPGEFHADPLAVLDFCRELTPRVVLRHDYHRRDFTVYLYRDEAAQQ